jgi:hypothetical protein
MTRYIALVFLLIYTTVPGVYGQVPDSVHFYGKDSIRFGATLTIPAGKRSFPGVVLVSGTGKQDRDGTMAGHPMFRVLADSLTRLGFAVLRVDDRGAGETGGQYETATTADFADDALTALEFLKRQPGVKKAGLIGHSEGGAAAIIAAAASENVDFIVTLAGLATKGLDALKLQNYGLINAAKISDYDKNRHTTINTLMFDTAYRYAYTPELEAKLRSTYNAWKHADDSAYQKDKPGEHDHMRFFVESYVRQATGAWYQYHLRYDPVPFLQKIKVPVLALNGDKDVMVPYQENLAMIGNTLRRSGNQQVTVKVLPGLNHLFQHCITCTREESATLKEDFAAEAWLEMRKWLQQLLVDGK